MTGSRAAILGLSAFLAGSLAQAQTTERASVDSSGVQGNSLSFGPALSGDGRYLAFRSEANNLVAGDTNFAIDVFVRDLLLGTTERVSLDSNGLEGNLHSEWPAISADGRFVAFHSDASNLVAGDNNGFTDVFVRDRLLGTTELASASSAGVAGDGASYWPALSADGRFVVFVSAAATLVGGDLNGRADVFVRDRSNGTTECVSLDLAGNPGDADSVFGALSADGRFVAFVSDATNLSGGDSNGARDVFVRDRLNGTTERVSLDSFGTQGNSDCDTVSISADGRFVAFNSTATNLVAGDTNNYWDIFVRDRLLGSTERVSVDSLGAEANWTSWTPSISADGRWVAFESYAANLVPGDTNLSEDVFLHDRLTGVTERISVDRGGAEANGSSGQPSISADGLRVAFSSYASNLVANDMGGIMDVFRRERAAPVPQVFCLGDGSDGLCPCNNSGALGAGCENSASTGGAVLTATGSAFLAGDTLVLTSSGELPSVLSIVLQGTLSITPASFGDGLRCTGGILKRLYVRNASGGVLSVPAAGDPSISARSASRGDVIAPGSTRYYQTYYRDPVQSFCPDPPGNNWNISSGIAVVWI